MIHKPPLVLGLGDLETIPDPESMIFFRKSALSMLGDPYRSLTRNFRLNPTVATRLTALLSEVDLSLNTGIREIETKRPPGSELYWRKPLTVSLDEVNRISYENGFNVLGGMFLVFLRGHGIDSYPLGRMDISHNDYYIIGEFYPDLVDFLTSPRMDGLSFDYRRFAMEVYRNNLGPMMVHGISNQNVTGEHLSIFEKVTFLKRVFRHFVRLAIPAQKIDNIIHSPEDRCERDLYLRLIKTRLDTANYVI